MRLLTLLLPPLLLSTLYILTTHLAQPPTNLKPKIFVIGLSRTGTTSIGNALALLGYKRLGWKDIRSRHLVNTYMHGDVSALVAQTAHFDAFEDLPWPYVYRRMAQLYPDAKFILSLRKDETTWLRSMRRHMARAGGTNWRPASYFYGADVDAFAENKGAQNDAEILSAYRNHTASVRAFFADKPHRYSELVIEDGDANWNTLCRIAECPQGGRVPALDFPKSNTAAAEAHEDNIFGFLHWLWVEGTARVERACAILYYKRDWPVVRRVLEAVWRVVSTVELACCELYFRLVVERQGRLPLKEGVVPMMRGRDD